MPETTEQVEGGGSKVAWPTIKAARQRPGDRPLIDSTGRKPHGWKRIETEPYIPVSALLSDEVVEAHARKPFELAGSHPTFWLELDAEERNHLLDESRACLQAAVDHLGGTDAH